MAQRLQNLLNIGGNPLVVDNWWGSMPASELVRYQRVVSASLVPDTGRRKVKDMTGSLQDFGLLQADTCTTLRSNVPNLS